jgi:hypothetical protein
LLPANNNNSRWGNVFFPSIGSARPYYVNGWPITLGRHEKKKKKKRVKKYKTQREIKRTNDIPQRGEAFITTTESSSCGVKEKKKQVTSRKLTDVRSLPLRTNVDYIIIKF